MVVVAEAGVVVAFVALVGRRRRRRLLHDVVVLLAVQGSALPQRELVPRQKLSRARATPETIDVVDLALGSHHEVALAERRPALVALGTEQSENEK